MRGKGALDFSLPLGKTYCMKFLFTNMYNVSGYRVTGVVREKQKDWENLLLSFFY